MKEQLSLLKNSPLFLNVNENSIEEIVKSISYKTKTYTKGEAIFSQGEVIHCFGIILSGQAQIESIDHMGNKVIIDIIEKGNIFGEVFAFSNNAKLTLTSVSLMETTVLLIDKNKILKSSAPDAQVVISNLFNIFSAKCIILSNKINILSKRTISDKLLTYLTQNPYTLDGKTIVAKIPLPRHKLADLLSCDRSSLQREIAKLQDSGVIKLI